MKQLKNALFLATVASSAIISSGAQAQTTANNDTGRQLHGTGATSIQTVLVQELNCMDGNQPLGLLPNTTSAIAEPTNLPLPTTTSTFDCSTTALGSGFAGQYIGTGSGAGLQAWRNVGTVDTTALPTATNPFAIPAMGGNPAVGWKSVQFGFSDSSAADSDLTTYTGGPGLTGAAYVAGGAPIVLPKFVLPVALAYAPVYGHKGSRDYHFTINTAAGNTADTAILGNPVGGLRVSRTTFCGIVNGTIKNFKASAFTTDNGGTSLMDPQDNIDSPGRWAADGVPVRLVGRVDKSGTTDIFTRAVTAQCGGNYLQNAQTLPYIRTAGSPDFTSVRPDTGLNPAGSDQNASKDTVLQVGNTFYNRSTNAYVPMPGGVSSNPVAGTDIDGTGLFMVADGSSGVAAAINKAPDFASKSDATFMLNGKIGYISADYLNGSPTGAGLYAAAIENPKLAAGSAYVLPTSNTATQAFAGIRPPQTNGTGATFSATDGTGVNVRSTTVPTYQGGGVGIPLRSNPLAWYNVLYIPAPGTTDTLANPKKGYPVTGTTQVLLYTCYKTDGTGDNAAAIRHWLGYNYDTVPADPAFGIFTVSPPNNFVKSGLMARSNLGDLGVNWKNAINETFLIPTSAATDTPTHEDLYIRNSSATGCTGVHAGV